MYIGVVHCVTETTCNYMMQALKILQQGHSMR